MSSVDSWAVTGLLIWKFGFRSEEPVRDVAFQLTQVPLPGLDRYAIELVALPAVDPSGRPTAEPGEVLAVEYFTLVSAT